MERAMKILRSRAGVAMPVLSVFMIFAMLFVFAALSLIRGVEVDKAAAQAALDTALRSAGANGTIIVPGTTIVLWNDFQALSAAESLIPMALPVALGSTSADGATFTPTSHAPQNWGPVTLSQFQTGSAGITPPACGTAPSVSPTQSWVSAVLSIPIHVGFGGLDTTLTVNVCDTQVANTYNGSQFNTP